MKIQSLARALFVLVLFSSAVLAQNKPVPGQTPVPASGAPVQLVIADSNPSAGTACANYQQPSYNWLTGDLYGCANGLSKALAGGFTYAPGVSLWSPLNLWVGPAQTDGYGTVFPTADPTWSPLTVVDTLASSARAYPYGFAAFLDVTVAASSAASETAGGEFIQITTTSDQASAETALTGLSVGIEHQGLGAIDSIVGQASSVSNDQASGVSLVAAFQGAANSFGGTVTDVEGMSLLANVGAGTATHLYGLDIEIQKAGGASVTNTPAALLIRDSTVGAGASALNISSVGATSHNSFDGDVAAGSLHVTPKTPASSTAACTIGQIAADTGFVYVCTATSTWKRAALSAF